MTKGPKPPAVRRPIGGRRLKGWVRGEIGEAERIVCTERCGEFRRGFDGGSDQ